MQAEWKKEDNGVYPPLWYKKLLMTYGHLIQRAAETEGSTV